MGDSIENWVKEHQSRLGGQYDDDNDRRITVRVGLGAYTRIDMLAAHFGMSKAKCAADLLTKAAVDAFDLSGLSEDELHEAIREQL